MTDAPSRLAARRRRRRRLRALDGRRARTHGLFWTSPGDCPYYRLCAGLPDAYTGGKPDGLCRSGCYDEPVCITDRWGEYPHVEVVYGDTRERRSRAHRIRGRGRRVNAGAAW